MSQRAWPGMPEQPPRQVCLPMAPAPSRVPTCVNSTWLSLATCTIPLTPLCSLCPTQGGSDGASECPLPAPRRGWVPTAPSQHNPTVPGSTDLLPGPELPARLHPSIYTANSWHMSPREEDWRGCSGPGIWGRTRGMRREQGVGKASPSISGQQTKLEERNHNQLPSAIKNQTCTKGQRKKDKRAGGKGRRQQRGDDGALGMMNYK